MDLVEKLFEKYVRLRTIGRDIGTVQKMMAEQLKAQLNKQQQQAFAGKCGRWESEHTHINLSQAQREALRRAALINITVEITFCPNCDSPNASNFTRCQVCNESLIVTTEYTSDEDGIRNGNQGSTFTSSSALILDMLTTDYQLRTHPQLSPIGLKVGRKTETTSPDIDLDAISGVDYGVSRMHAVIRFNKSTERVYLIDMGSTNGTFINNFRLPPKLETIISDGDVIKFGKMVFKVYFDRDESSETSE